MDIVMINDVVLEGIVANIWRYAVALLFRLACYRHPDLPLMPLYELQDATAFVTLQVPQSNLGAWVHGFLHSRDYKGSLADFGKDGHGAELLVLEKLDPSELQAPRGTTEVVAQRIMSQVNGSIR
jgi:hypothetical protein